MAKGWLSAVSCSALLVVCGASRAGAAEPASEHPHGDAAVAKAMLGEIQTEAQRFFRAKDGAFFTGLAKGQHPRATVVTCSDSRVQTTSLDNTPEGDLFVIRNIGNQLATAKGSVQYGVNHLASSLLLFLGHSSCGAIKAASGDFSKLEPDIRKELATIKIPKGVTNIEGVKANVHAQVAAAVKEWGPQVKAGHLMVVGAVYDFSDELKAGAGRLHVIDVNGASDPKKLGSMTDAAKESAPQKADHAPAHEAHAGAAGHH